MEEFDEKKLVKELKIDAKAVGLAAGAAEIFIDKSIAAAKKSLGDKKIITNKDLERTITKELQKYNADFAYVYRNRDRII